MRVRRVIKNVLKRHWLILSLVALAAQPACAQYDPAFSHYWALEPVFNPAAVGKEQKVNVAAAYAKSMAGFENSP